MNTPESESLPPRPPGLQIELGAKPTRHFRTLWLVPLLAFLAIGSVTLLAWLPKSSPTLSSPPNATFQNSQSTQPKITWSENQIAVILSPGESTAKDLTFSSSLNLSNVVLEPVPEIARYLTITPNTFAGGPANTPQSVRVNFSIASGATLGTYQGTIHLRIGTQTLPETLKIILNVWRVFRNSSDSNLGFSFYFPPTLSLREGFGASEILLALAGKEGQFPEISFESFSTANTDATTLEDSLRHSNLANLQIDELIVGNVLAKRFSGYSNLSDGTQWKITRIFAVTAFKIYLISADNADPMLDQILPTVVLH